MRKDEQQRQEPEGKYRVKNWPAYNAGLIARGDVTIWMERDLWQPGAEADAVRRGRPRVYADAVIQMLLGLKQVFRLPLRALQGFAASMNKLAFADLPVPNYTTLCRRARDLDVVLPTLRSGEPLHLVVDSTDLKVFGEGEWKVRKHGYSKRRTWRKVHLAMDANTGQICVALMTHQDVGDGEVLPELLDQIPAGTPIDIVGGDGAYDTRQCHAAIAARGATPSIPPRDGAAPWSKRTPGATWRNGAIDVIGQSSRRDWKKGCGYGDARAEHQRRRASDGHADQRTVIAGVCTTAALRAVESKVSKIGDTVQMHGRPEGPRRNVYSDSGI
jgi:hypothetical protein